MELTPYQLRIVAQTVNAEAGGESQEGQAAVAWVILNRAMEGRLPGGTDPAAVALARGQFSSWNKGKGGNNLVYKDPPAAIVAIVKGVFGGTIPDPTNGANHFLNKEATRAGRPGHNLPEWWTRSVAKNGEQQIGRHWFTSDVKLPPRGIPNPKGDWRGQVLKANNLAPPSPAVEDLQNMLANAGFYKGDANGIMRRGDPTELALRAFQRAAGGLKIDGLAGPRTFDALQKAVAARAIKSMAGITAPFDLKAAGPYNIPSIPGMTPPGKYPAAAIPNPGAIPRGGIGKPISGLDFAGRFWGQGGLSTDFTSPTTGENFTPLHSGPGRSPTGGWASTMAADFARLPARAKGGTFSIDAGTAGPTVAPSWAKLPSGPGRSPSGPAQSPAKAQAAFDRAYADFKEQERVIQATFPEYKPYKAPPSGPGRAPSGPVAAPATMSPTARVDAGPSLNGLGVANMTPVAPFTSGMGVAPPMAGQGLGGPVPMGFGPPMAGIGSQGPANFAERFGVDMSMGGEGALNPEQPGSQVNRIWNAAGRNPTFNPYDTTIPMPDKDQSPYGAVSRAPSEFLNPRWDKGLFARMATGTMAENAPGIAPIGADSGARFSPNMVSPTDPMSAIRADEGYDPLSSISQRAPMAGQDMPATISPTARVDAGPSLNGLGVANMTPVAPFTSGMGVAPPMAGQGLGGPVPMGFGPPMAGQDIGLPAMGDVLPFNERFSSSRPTVNAGAAYPLTRDVQTPPLSGGVPPDMPSRPPAASPSAAITMPERFAATVGARSAPVQSVQDFKAGFSAGQASVMGPAKFNDQFNATPSPTEPDFSRIESTDQLRGGTGTIPSGLTGGNKPFGVEGFATNQPYANYPADLVTTPPPAAVPVPGGPAPLGIPGVSIVGDPGVAAPMPAVDTSVGGFDVLSGTGTAGALAAKPIAPASAPAPAPPLQPAVTRTVPKAAPATTRTPTKAQFHAAIASLTKQLLSASPTGFGGFNAAGVGAPIPTRNTVSNPNGGVIQFGSGGAPPSSPFYNGGLGFAISSQSGYPLTPSQIAAELSNPGLTTYVPNR